MQRKVLALEEQSGGVDIHTLFRKIDSHTLFKERDIHTLFRETGLCRREGIKLFRDRGEAKDNNECLQRAHKCYMKHTVLVVLNEAEQVR